MHGAPRAHTLAVKKSFKKEGNTIADGLFPSKSIGEKRISRTTYVNHKRRKDKPGSSVSAPHLFDGPSISSARARLTAPHRPRPGPHRTPHHTTVRHRRTKALFISPPNFKFFHSLSITSIFRRIHRVLNIGKKNN